MADNRIWLDVAFAEKDEAKAHGARWNPTARRWYVPRPGMTALDRWQALPDVPNLLPCPRTQVSQHIDAAFALWRRRSAIAWELDLSILVRAGVAVTKPLPPLSARICPAKFFAASDAVNV